MAAVSLPAVNLAYAFFVLVPGFLSYRIARHVGKVTVSLDRFDKTAYTLLGSGAALSILVLTYSFLLQRPLESVVNQNYTTTELGIGYLVLLLIASTVGVICGYIIDEHVRSDLKARRENTWELTMDEAEAPVEVRVVTSGGDEILGYVNIYGSRGHGQDLLLQYPQRILRENGEVVKKKSTGNQVFISENDISQIYFSSEINIM